MAAKITPGNNCTNCSKRFRCPDYFPSEGSWCAAYHKDVAYVCESKGKVH